MTAAEPLLIGESEPRAVLRASIVRSTQHEYAVALKPADGAPISEQACLRFALHYYARVLYELVRSSRSVRDLPSLIDRIAIGTIGWRGDLFDLAGVRGSVVLAVRQPAGDVAVALRRVGVRDFDVEGDFRMTGRPLAVSVIAVLQAIAARLSPDAVTAMLAALANMNVSYTLTHHYHDPRSFREVPTIAYHAASFV